MILDLKARTRRELARKIGSISFVTDGEYYDVNEVWAESSSNDTAGGAALGGLIGLIGGGAGVVVGGILGGLVGGLKDQEEKKMVQQFNSSMA